MIYYKKEKKNISITLYKENYSDYEWYEILHNLEIIKCDYIFRGIHDQAEEICLSDLQTSQIVAK